MEKEQATEAYVEGRKAFLNKKKLGECPYAKNSHEKYLWIGGYNVEKCRLDSCVRKNS